MKTYVSMPDRMIAKIEFDSEIAVNKTENITPVIQM